MQRPSTKLLAPLLLLLGSGWIGACESSETEDPQPGAAGSGGTTPIDAGTGGTAPPTDAGLDAGQGGTAPVDAGPADVTAGLLYIHQQVFREDDAFARGGLARLELYDPQALPPDDRPEFFNADGERCTFETGTEWPLTLPNGDTWPAGPFYDAGNLSLTAAGAPGPVVYEYYDTYYVRQSPGPVVLGSFTHSSFFPPEYIPHGAAASFAAPGGADIGAFSFSGVTLAADYTVTAPDLVVGSYVINTSDPLTFTWSPPAPGDSMAVIVKDSFSFLKCVFDDDGVATIPAEAMATLVGGQFVRLTVQTWREHRETQRVVSADGEQIDVELTSRHVQIGRFDSL
ncbi:MAG: hypothetical protein JRI23_25060 [Deltaproteobacteria bacterium]|jgi:hypothetical protein|nr:hypothetical protein [Deltaproteobacteria bacterium]MBW2535287.1 hypothetical protein [Deltaproteobacteria bacterium]